jgi:hypothetical protein
MLQSQHPPPETDKNQENSQPQLPLSGRDSNSFGPLGTVKNFKGSKKKKYTDEFL